jgi:hypothetical protein
MIEEIEEGCTPADARVLRKANHELIDEISALRIELEDALMMAYGAECNWPETALKALGDTGR